MRLDTHPLPVTQPKQTLTPSLAPNHSSEQRITEP
jgi:hypothetical protein